MPRKKAAFFSGYSRIEVILVFVGLFILLAFAGAIVLSSAISAMTPMQEKVCDALLEMGKSGFICFLTLIGTKAADVNKLIE